MFSNSSLTLSNATATNVFSGQWMDEPIRRHRQFFGQEWRPYDCQQRVFCRNISGATPEHVFQRLTTVNAGVTTASGGLSAAAPIVFNGGLTNTIGTLAEKGGAASFENTTTVSNIIATNLLFNTGEVTNNPGPDFKFTMSTNIWEVRSNGVLIGYMITNGALNLPFGSLAAPALTFGGTANGIDLINATTLGIAMGGTQTVQFSGGTSTFGLATITTVGASKFATVQAGTSVTSATLTSTNAPTFLTTNATPASVTIPAGVITVGTNRITWITVTLTNGIVASIPAIVN